ncbi:MAG: glycosyltransferase 87 family protein [Thermoleophilaceae bacterium]
MLAAPAAGAATDLKIPPSQTKPPRFFKRSAEQVIRIANGARKVRQETHDRGHPLQPTAYTKGFGTWQVSYFDHGDELVQVKIDDPTGAIIEQWRGPQVAWTMARGYPGAFGRKLNAPYVWIPLCVLFLVPFVDPRRPFRLLHLDLLVLLAFGVSHIYFNEGEIGKSVPLAYPVLVYLLVRMLFAGFRPRRRAGPLVPLVPIWLLAAGVLFIATFRVGLNVTDSNVIDVGYAGVIGADRIVDGHHLYGKGFATDVERGDTYGPVDYLLYVPFEQALPWSGRWDDLPAAHAAAIAFDLLTLGGLFLLGRRLRAGPEGHALGTALAYAWVAYPYTAFSLETNSNDTVVALFCVAALLGLTLVRRRLSAVATGAAIALGAAAKFVSLALAPLFAPRRRGELLVYALALAAVIAATVLPFVPHGGLREMYDRTVGYQAGRPSPFSIWGQETSLDWLQTTVKAATAALALLLLFLPRTRDLRQIAALGAAVVLAVELGMTHWFYLYVVWFVPFVLVALFAGERRSEPPAPVREKRPATAVPA